MKKKQTMLVIGHGHPDLACGGAEHCAYESVKAYRSCGVFDRVLFLARTILRISEDQLYRYRNDEFLWWHPGFTIFDMVSSRLAESSRVLCQFLEQAAPDIVHIQHPAGLGLNIIQTLKRYNPDLPVFLTLHEYLSICPQNGTMLNVENSLCSFANPIKCLKCFPSRKAGDFWLRKRRIMHYLSLVDGFIAPSRFLRDRYCDWGLSADKITVIENGVHLPDNSPPVAKRPRNRYGYFGSVNPFKGITVVLRALALMPPEDRSRLVIKIHGANLNDQGDNFKQEIRTLIKKYEEEGCVIWLGPYRREDLPRLMEDIDWEIVPSIWWENSPVVIQEAFSYKKPVICSNIGGMAEKVKHNVNGLHVSAGDPAAWADVLRRTAGNDELWEYLSANIEPPVSREEATKAHLALFGFAGSESYGQTLRI